MRATILIVCLVIIGVVAGLRLRSSGDAASNPGVIIPERPEAVVPTVAEKSPPHWPQFRGPGASGSVEGYTTPVTWNVETFENIKWRTRIPGLGFSSPAIWGDRLFITTAIGEEDDPELRVGLYGDIAPVDDDSIHTWHVLCLDKRTGQVLWDVTAHEGVPQVKRHPKSSHANSTPATDGTHVVAFFGSEGLYCYDLEGKLLWKRDFGLLDSAFFAVPTAQWGFASSPIIYKDMVLIQSDVLEGSFIAALNIEDGTEVWRTSRDDVPTWSTPAVHESDRGTQVIVNGFRHIGGYDLSSGQELWRLSGGGDIPVPTPIVAHDLIYITGAHGPQAPIFAIRPSATGDISLTGDASTNEHIAWSYARRGIYMQTPLAYGDQLYFCGDAGVLSCFDAKTGTNVYQRRIAAPGTRNGYTASAVASDGKIYFTSEEGEVVVVQAGPKYWELGRNSLKEICMATPAISEGMLFFRTQKHLFGIGG